MSSLQTADRAAERPLLLLVDDDPLIIESLRFVLEDRYQVLTAATRGEVRSLLRRSSPPPSLALVDLGLPPAPHAPEEGFALVEDLLAFNRRMKILVLSGQNERANIRHALTLGAVDFVPKPCDIGLLKSRLEYQQMMLAAEQPEETQPSPARLLGDSPAMGTLRALIRQFAKTPFPVLIEGESGSGKELVAQAIHAESDRSEEKFLAINCAAFTPELLEAQLFGHARGAFTGAESAKPGFFEQAHGGTLFLDEIGEFPLSLQPKLLRVLENGEYYRIGETEPRRTEARILAATNRDLREEVRAGRFRPDLYHRLGVLTVRVPPLREREGDALSLFEMFRTLYAGRMPSFTLTKEGAERLRRYGFPGNVRELRNIVIRLSAKYASRSVGASEIEAELETECIPNAGDQNGGMEAEQALQRAGFILEETLAEWERRYIQAALRLSGGNISKAARLLGVNRTHLYSRLQRLGIHIGN
ncbi:MAG TPA: sigma-54 dependent transcriptional regulator [Gammaproteobacteria bacterium]|nr:sigma-54 dependent transcriptional regulator [Gammaproteobacteria bacterium]